jgi:hypothetical protein
MKSTSEMLQDSLNMSRIIGELDRKLEERGKEIEKLLEQSKQNREKFEALKKLF